MPMLTKKHRLPEKSIDRVKGGGRHYQTPFFAVVYLSDQKTPSQFAFVLSRRVSKQATIRNKTKRLIAGSVRQLINNLKDGHWVVFLIKRAALGQSKDLLAETVEEAFRKIKLFKEDE